jgi:hypothetical protein
MGFDELGSVPHRVGNEGAPSGPGKRAHVTAARRASVEHCGAMHTEYFHRWMDLLLARLEPGERLLARGRAFEPRDALRFDLSTVISGPGCAVAVTERCVLWVSRDDDRWVRSLPFAVVRSHAEITQAHRYALALDHESIERLQSVPAHQLLWWAWGNAEAVQCVTGSVLAFSRRDTKAARAIRSRLQAMGVRTGEPRSLPTHRRPGQEVPYGVLRAQITLAITTGQPDGDPTDGPRGTLA